MNSIQRLSSLLDRVVDEQYTSPLSSASLTVEALDLAEQLLQSSTLTGEEWRRVQSDYVTALLASSQFAMQRGDISLADQRRTQALDVSRELNDPATLAKCLLHIGSVSVVTGKHALAKEQLEEAYEHFVAINHISGYVHTKYNLAMLASRQDRIGDALTLYTECSIQAGEHTIVPIQLGCLVSIGTLYEQQREFDKALEHYKSALELSESIGDISMQSNTLANIATALFNSGHIDESLRFLKQAKTILLNNNSLYQMCTLLNNEGATLLSTGRIDDSLASYGEAIQYCESMSNQREMAIAYAGRAIAWLRMGADEKALRDTQEGLRLSSDIDSPIIVIRTLASAIEVYIQVGQLDKAQPLIEKSLALDSSMETRTITLSILELASKAYEQNRNYKQALLLQKSMYQLYKDKHEVESSRRMLLYTADVRVAVAERDREILTLQNARLREEIDGKLRELTAMTLAMAERGVQSTSKVGNVVWQVFDEQFNALNTTFSERLARRCPALTSTEMRVCALMKVGLGTKDVAQLMHVTDRAIEKHRYNIRRKLGLDSTVNLTTWLERMVLQD